MTISYSDNYFKILSHWRGSAWKAVWKELLLWLIFYYSIKLILECALSTAEQQTAKKVVALFASYTDKVPLQFLLGFYVAWVCALIPEDDQDAKLRRHTVARYLVLSETLVLRTVSSRVRKRFPTLQILVDCELMTKEELELYKKCPCPNTGWQLPLQWALNGVMIPLATRPDKPVTVGTMGHMINTFNTFRGNLRQLFMYDWICIPLVYTQTVSVVVYGYFAICCIGHQALGTGSDIFVPVLTILQFVFFVGWFKVAQDLMRPFGEDDDDVELNYLLDRHAAVAMNMANYVTTNNPPFSADPYFQKIEKCDGLEEPFNLAYTKLSLMKSRDRPPKLHATFNVKQPEVQLQMTYKPQPDTAQPTLENAAACSNGTAVANSTAPVAARDARTVHNHSLMSTLKRSLKKFIRSDREHIYF